MGTVLLNDEELRVLEDRVGRVHLRHRLGIEKEYEDKFDGRINFSHPHKWYSLPSLIMTGLKLTGLRRLGLKNAEQIEVRHVGLQLPGLPPAFDGFTILHLSDLHADMNPGPMEKLIGLLGPLEYDLCVLTGDFRGHSFGPCDEALRIMARVRDHLNGLVYGVLGNHDTIRMLPALEAMDIRMLVNESEPISRGSDRIHLAGVDDASYYSAANIEKSGSQISPGEFSILLSHTPEIYKHAAYAGFNLFLAGHTHGGQICLPGSAPITLSCDVPRRIGAGRWDYQQMVGYTSVGAGSSVIPVRFNCPPEITLHHLHATGP
jgi:predicted MPP superfamily phosphohydrolase